MRLFVKLLVLVVILILFNGCGVEGFVVEVVLLLVSGFGLVFDYFVVVGDLFIIDGMIYKFEDKFSYDVVGYVLVWLEGVGGILVVYKMLLLLSYVEVILFESGWIILVCVEWCGLMINDCLIEFLFGVVM